MPNLKKHLNWRVWLRGLIGSVVNSCATAFVAAQIDPTGFNLQGGLENLIKLVAFSAAMGAALYLKQAPMPEDAAEDEQSQPPV